MPQREGNGTWKPGAEIAASDTIPTPGGGLLLCGIEHLFQWRQGTPFLVQCLGDAITAAGGVFVTRARTIRPLVWTARERRLFAADCAARALAHDGDPAPEAIEAIGTARRFANGELPLAYLDGVRQAVADVRGRRRQEVVAAEAVCATRRDPIADTRFAAMRISCMALESVLRAVEPAVCLTEAAALFAVEAAAAGALLATGRPLAGRDGGTPDRQAEQRWQSLRKWELLTTGSDGNT